MRIAEAAGRSPLFCSWVFRFFSGTVGVREGIALRRLTLSDAQAMNYDPTFGDLLDDEQEQPKRTRRNGTLDDDLDSVERGDRGDDLTEGSTLEKVMEDPENAVQVDEDEAYQEADDEDLDEAETLDMTTFKRGRERGFNRDAFEEWLKLSRTYGNLTLDEIEECVDDLQSEDPQVVADAEEKLVCHSIRWIVRSLRKVAGSRVMDRPGDHRNDVLSIGRLGFLMGIRQYDPEKARSRGASGHKKSLLHFTDYWIKKLYFEEYARKELGLNPDAAEDRDKVRKAEAALKASDGTSLLVERLKAEGTLPESASSLGHSPSLFQIQLELELRACRRLARKELQKAEGGRPSEEDIGTLASVYEEELREARQEAWREMAAEELAEEGIEPDEDVIASRVESYRKSYRAVEYPVSRELRRSGALVMGRIKDLRRHSTVQESLDAPALDDDSGPTLKEYLASQTDGADEVVAADQVTLALSKRLDRVAGRKKRRLVRERYGLVAEHGEGRHAVSNPEELMYWAGRSTRESISSYEDQVERELRGETLVDADGLTRPGLNLRPNDLKRLHRRISKAEKALQEAREDVGTQRGLGGNAPVVAAERTLDAVRSELEDVREQIRGAVNFLQYLDDNGIAGVAESRVACPFEESEARTVEVDEDGFCCEACGREGTLFEWLQSQDLNDVEVDMEAARAAVAIPPSVAREGDKVVALEDPRRRERLSRLQR